LIVYAPHVLEANGQIVTPDLLCSHLTVHGIGTPDAAHTVPVERLSTRSQISEPIDRLRWWPALAAFAAPRGVLLCPAAILADGQILDSDPAAAVRACTQLISRSALRDVSPAGESAGWGRFRVHAPTAAPESPASRDDLAARYPALGRILGGGRIRSESVSLFACQGGSLRARGPVQVVLDCGANGDTGHRMTLRCDISDLLPPDSN
jgi:hypothetical protein